MPGPNPSISLTRDYQAARDQFQPALAYFQQTRESDHLLASYIGLGLAREGLGQYAEAAQVYRQAVELMEEQRAALPPASRTHFLQGQVGAGFPRILAYEGLVRTQSKRQDLAEAFFWAEHTKARVLLEALARGGPPVGLPPTLAQQEEELTTRMHGLYRQREVAFRNNPDLYRQIEEAELPQAKQELAQFVRTLRRDSPAYAALTYPQPVPVTDLRLPPQEVLIAYEVTETETFVWVLKEGKIVKALTIPVTRHELTIQVKQYRGFFAGITDYPHLARFDPHVGKALYNLLFNDLMPFFQPDDRLIIIPDEILGILPFEALVMELPSPVKMVTGKYGPVPQGVRYVGDLYSISYAQSATALHLARTLTGAQPRTQEKLLVLADPVFDPVTDARLQEQQRLLAQREDGPMRVRRAVGESWQGSQDKAFPRLEITGQLATRLARLYGKPRVEVLQGVAASEPAFRQQPLS
jgi:tetratricopeptide (TPR) repeat protein